jgi:dUTP pyrophosphatase
MATLDIHIENESLHEFYKNRQNYMSDSGFDLYTPADTTIPAHGTAKIDLGITAEPKFSGGYYLYPRSSISKTPLRLANSVGIIDNGYRGHIIAVVDNISTADWTVKRGERLFQLCHPSLQPLHVSVVSAPLSVATERGTGGFGSTNIAAGISNDGGASTGDVQ